MKVALIIQEQQGLLWLAFITRVGKQGFGSNSIGVHDRVAGTHTHRGGCDLIQLQSGSYPANGKGKRYVIDDEYFTLRWAKMSGWSRSFPKMWPDSCGGIT